MPHDVLASGWILGINGTRQIETTEVSKIRPAMLAVTHPRAGPTIREDSIYPIERDDLLSHLGHELEVIRSQRTGDPKFRIGGVPALTSIRADRDPIRVRIVDVLMHRVRIGARHYVHAELPAAFYQVAEAIPIAQPLTAVVQRDLCRVVGHAAARAQAGRVRVNLAEIVQPKLRRIVSRVVLHKHELRPAHRPAVPAFLCCGIDGRSYQPCVAPLAPVPAERATAAHCATNCLRVGIAP